MNDMDVTLIKKNIRRIYEEHGLTQTELAGIIGVSQSRISNLLNLNNTKESFSLHHLYKISQTFHVSIDELVGMHDMNTQLSSMDVHQICTFLTGLIKNDYLSIQETVLEESNIYVSETDADGEDTGRYVGPVKRFNKYLTFYFSNYHQLRSPNKTADDLVREKELLEESGNDHAVNREINTFLSNYYELYKLYQERKLPLKTLNGLEATLLKDLQRSNRKQM